MPPLPAPLPGEEAGGAASEDTRGLFLRVFPSIALPIFLAAVDQTIVSTALPDIAGNLGDVARISWIVVSYLIAATVAAPVYGRLGDVLGRRRLMFAALALFVAASLLCMLAPTMLLLSAARVLQGFGGGGLMTLSQAIVGETVPPRERGRYQGYLASVFMAASAFGPVAGGWLTQQYGWRSVFLVNLPLGLLAGLLALRLPARAGSGGSVAFDWLGLALFTLFVVPILLALERAQQPDAAAIPAMLGLAAIGTLSLALLLRHERRAATPLIPVRLLRDPSIWRCDALSACAGAIVVSGVTFMPIYLQVARGVSPGGVGLLLLPLTVGIAFGSLVTGRLIARTGRTALFPSLGQPVVAAMWVLLAALAPAIPLGALPLAFIVMAMAQGTAMPVVQTTVQGLAGREHLGAASASVQFSRSIGAAFGTALVGAVLFATLAARDPAAAGLFAAVVERDTSVLAALTPARQAAFAAEVAFAFRSAFLAVAAFGAVGAVLAWTLPARRV
jgi:EmrB/QacA subfamily drug resistance transporter